MATRVPLTNSSRFAIVDDDHAGRLSRHKWFLAGTGVGYAARHVGRGRKGRRLVFMHYVVGGAPTPDMEWDHINGNGLDNRRENLRLATHQQNLRNKKAYKCRVDAAAKHSRFKGVAWRSDTKKWRAQIHVNGRRLSLGNFGSEQEAATAYDRAARKHFGDFARLNFPSNDEQPAMRRAA